MRHGYDAEGLSEFCDGLLAFARLVADLPAGRFVPAGPKDDMIVATAVAARADYLVTGGRKHLLPIGVHRGVRLVAKRQLPDLLQPTLS